METSAAPLQKLKRRRRIILVVKHELNLEWKHLINLFGLDYCFICRLCIKCRSYMNWNGIGVDGSFHF